jgi:hypothetical protein
MSRCQRKMVPGVTISRIAERRSIGSVPASSASHARWRSIKISASFHHDSRRDNLSSDTARETTRKIRFKLISRRAPRLGCRCPHDRDSGLGQPGVLGVNIADLDPDHHRAPGRAGRMPGDLEQSPAEEEHQPGIVRRAELPVDRQSGLDLAASRSGHDAGAGTR